CYVPRPLSLCLKTLGLFPTVLRDLLILSAIRCDLFGLFCNRQNVSVFEQTGPMNEFICPSPGTCQTILQAQLVAPVQDIREVCGRRCFLPFAQIRRQPTSDIPIAACRVAFAHVIAVHRRPGSWSLVG